MIITQNGEAKAVIQDIESYEQTQETTALLKILALGMRQIEEGKIFSCGRYDKKAARKTEGLLMSEEEVMIFLAFS